MDHSLTYGFFFGANSAGKFVSLFEGLYDYDEIRKRYIIKGGPGCGKSTMMKRMVEFYRQEGREVEQIFCSSDPYSLDAMLCREAGVSFVDGTAPHVIEPMYPGVRDTYLNFSDFWDERAMAAQEEQVMGLTQAVGREFAGAFALLSGAKALVDDAMDRVLPLASIEGIHKRARGIALREIPRRRQQPMKEGRLYCRFLSAISPYGAVFLSDTPAYLAEKVYVLLDSYGLAPFLLEPICRQALAAGLDVYACYCPLNPQKLEHVLIPALSLALITEHEEVRWEGECHRRVHLDHYLDRDGLSLRRAQLRESRKGSRQLVARAVDRLSAAKALHDQLEECYVPAVDFSRVEQLIQTLQQR